MRVQCRYDMWVRRPFHRLRATEMGEMERLGLVMGLLGEIGLHNRPHDDRVAPQPSTRFHRFGDRHPGQTLMGPDVTNGAGALP